MEHWRHTTKWAASIGRRQTGSARMARVVQREGETAPKTNRKRTDGTGCADRETATYNSTHEPRTFQNTFQNVPEHSHDVAAAIYAPDSSTAGWRYRAPAVAAKMKSTNHRSQRKNRIMGQVTQSRGTVHRHCIFIFPKRGYPYLSMWIPAFSSISTPNNNLHPNIHPPTMMPRESTWEVVD